MRCALLNPNGLVYSRPDLSPEVAWSYAEQGVSIVVLADEAPVPEYGQRHQDEKGSTFVDDKAFLAEKAAQLAEIATQLDERKQTAERDRARIEQAPDALEHELRDADAKVDALEAAQTDVLDEKAAIEAKRDAAPAKLGDAEPIEDSGKTIAVK